ncbi:Ig-like domain-containing protein [uncultured Polaribacter sp.]|uniref:Ig-like domain-containing protein n=1 Tax=uncultured Polaribacter sp. TaxID=174711 RepID=UPI002627B737|nr:Ig-like domain-containing protein [uncultured Polaribacter sp.]
MRLYFKFLLFTTSIILFINCAKTGRPDGGPKDEKAPLFVISEPPYKSINFNKKEIKLYFNEFIKLKDLNKQLIVSPPLKNPLLITPQGTASKFLKIEIIDTLKLNTTYIFNFGNAVEDNNESNVLEGFKYIFSTGTYIDSLTSTGIISDAFKNTKPKRIDLALYKIDSTYTDSIIYKEKPNYVTTAIDTTGFRFTNLRKGKYLLIAIEDASSDYIFDPKVDKIGFYTDTLQLPRDSIIAENIRLFKEIQPYKFKRGKEITKGKIEFGYEGKIKDLKVNLLSKVPDSFKSVAKLDLEKDTLNYWHTPIDADSLNFTISNANFIDSVTVFLRKKKIDSLQLSASTNSVLHFRDTFFIKSNNPIIHVDTTKIIFTDKDTINVDYRKMISKKENKIGLLFKKKEKERYKLQLLPGAIRDLFAVKNDTLNYNFSTKEFEDYGRITLQVVNNKNYNVIVDLLADKDKIIERNYIKSTETLIFKQLEPNKYTFRAIIDKNNNRIWDTGNFLKKQMPEKVIYFSEILNVRANNFLEGNTFTIE